MIVEEQAVLAEILGASTVGVLDNKLTSLMLKQRIQSILSIPDALDQIVDRILVLSSQDDTVTELSVAAILMRLAAVARGKEHRIHARLEYVFSDRPGSIELLADGDQKSYAAQSLKYLAYEWVTDYAITEALSIDSADIARRELLFCGLGKTGNLSAWLTQIANAGSALKSSTNPDSKYRRVRRILSSVFDVANAWQGEVGVDPGRSLGNCVEAFFGQDANDADDEVVFEAIDKLLSILIRVIELRFSLALEDEIYQVLVRGKRSLTPGGWMRFLAKSSSIVRVRLNLLEAALVLARQRLTDKAIMNHMVAAYGSRSQLSIAVSLHFSNAKDLDPDIAHWWSSVGDITESHRKVEHRVGNNEDQQIGELLISVQSNEEVMQRVSSAVVPLLQVSDPVLAATVKGAASGYREMAQIARRLGRMRKLESTTLRGAYIDFSPLDHEMVGGPQPGVRRVKVTREGIIKDFGGKKKILVKPWVEPSDGS